MSVLDLGCGDWKSTQHVNWEGILYLGIDVVTSIIQTNIERYGSTNVRFEQLDSLASPLPQADLLIIKDVLQHWSNAQIGQLEPRLTNFPFVLITDTRETATTEREYVQAALNSDIEPGDMRPLDLSQSPLGWPVKEVFRHTSVVVRHRQNKGYGQIRVRSLTIRLRGP